VEPGKLFFQTSCRANCSHFEVIGYRDYSCPEL
jgi:hypothetical protein